MCICLKLKNETTKMNELLMNFVLGDYMKNFYSVCNINLFRVQYKLGGGVYWGIFSDRGMNKFSANV